MIKGTSRSKVRGKASNFSNQSKRKVIAIAAASAVASMAGYAESARAGTISKANNTTILSSGGAWTGGVAPASTDIAQFNSTILSGTSTYTLGGAANWGELQVLSPGAAITLNNDASSSTLTLTGIVTGSTTVGIDMSAATQNLTINTAMLLGSAQQWNIASGRTLAIGGNVLNTGGNLLTINNAGAVTFAATDFNATAGITFRGGGSETFSSPGLGTSGSNFGTSTITNNGGLLTFNISTTTANAILNGTTTKLAMGGSEVSIVFSASVTTTFANLAVNAGENFIHDGRNGGFNDTVNFTNFTRSLGGTLDGAELDTSRFIQTFSGLGTTALVTSGGAAFLTLGDVAGGAGENSFENWAAINGTHQLTAAGYTAATATTLANNANIATGTLTTTLSAPTTIASFRDAANQATTINLGGNLLTTGGILVTGDISTAGSNITNGTLTGAANQDLVVLVSANSQTAVPFTIGASIVNNTSTALTKGAPGTLILTGNNTFTNGVYINEGVVQLGNTGALNVSGVNAINFDGSGASSGALSQTNTLGATTTYVPATLALAGNSITVASISSANVGTGANVTIENANGAAVSAATLTFGGSSTTSYVGTIKDGAGGGTLGITMAGSGTQNIGGTLSYSGPTNVNSGTLGFTTAPTGSTVFTVASGAELNFSGVTAGFTLSNGKTLSGLGTVGGLLNLTSGTITPGNTTTGVGSLTFGSLNISGLPSAPLFNFNIAAGNNSTEIGVLNSNGLTLNGGKINLFDAGSVLPGNIDGTYNLFSYSGVVQGSGAPILTASSILDPVNNLTYTFTDTGAGVVQLTIAGTPPVTGVWNFNGNSNWNNASNWIGGVPQQAQDQAIFGNVITSPTTVTLDANESVGSVQFNSPGANGSYTIAGTNTLTLDNGGAPATIVDTAGTHIIATPMTFNSSVNASVANSGDSMTFTGQIGGTGALAFTGPGTLALASANTYSGGTTLNSGLVNFVANGLGTGSVSFNGGTLQWATGNTTDISTVNGSPNVVSLINTATLDTNGNTVTLANAIGNSGTVGLVKNGLGTLDLAAANTFSGTTTVNGGLVAIASDASLGTAPASPATYLTFNPSAGSTVGLITTGATSLSANRNIALNGSSTGLVTFDNGGNTDTIGGIISGTGSLTMLNSGSLLLNSADTFSGTTVVGAGGGTLVLGNSLSLQNSTLNYNNQGGSLSFGSLSAATLGGLAGSQSLALTNVSSGPVALTVGGNGATTTYSGSLSGIGGSLVKVGTGTLALSGTNTYSGGTTFNAGIVNFTASALGSGPITFNGGDLQWATGNTVDISGVTVTLQGTATLDTNGNTVTLANAIGNSGTGGLVKNGLGTLDLAAANTFSGATTVNGGLVAIASDASLGTAPASPATYLTFNPSAGSTVGLITTGATSLSANRNIALNGSSTGLVTFDNGGNTDTIGGIISGTGSLTMLNSGSLLLNSADTFSGTTVVGAGGGTLVLGNSLSLQNSTLNYNNQGGSLSFGSLSAATLGGLAGSQSLALTNVSSGPVALTVGNNNANTVYSGSLSGTGASVTKVGTGTLTVNNTNSYTGGTNFNNGIVNFTVGSLGTGPLTFNGGTLQWATGNTSDISTFTTNFVGNATLDTNGNNVSFANAIGNSGAGNLFKAGAGNITVNAPITSTGGIQANLGNLILNTGSSWTGTFANAANGAQLAVSGGTLVANALSFAGTGGLSDNISGGSATFNGGLFEDPSAATSSNIQVTGNGTLTASFISIGRPQAFLTQPTAAATASGLYVNGGVVNITGAFNLGNNAATSSSSNSRIDSGSLTVGGTTQITLFNNLTRWSIFQVNGGTFTSNDTTGAGVEIGGGVASTEDVFLVSGGISTIQKLTFGDAIQTAGVDVFSLTGGTIYIGSGGIVSGNANPTYTQTISLTGGIIGAANNWSTTIPMQLVSGTTTLKPSNSTGTAFNMTLGGLLSGTGALTINGAGTVDLPIAETFTGATTITSGTLFAGNTASLSTTSGVTFNPTTGNTATLILASAAPSLKSLSNSGAGLSQLVLGNSVAPSSTALTVGSASSSGTFSGVISDAGNGATGSLIKVGTGALLLSGVNTFSGGTTINAGSIQANSDSSLGNTAGFVLVNAGTLEDVTSYSSSRQYEVGNTASTLKIDAGQTLTLNTGIINGPSTGTLNVTGPGILALNGGGSYTGGTTIGSSAIVQINSDTSLGATTGLALINAGTLEATSSFTSGRLYEVGNTASAIKVDGGQTLALTLGITNGPSAGTLNVTGPGLLVLNGTDTYTGGTNITNSSLMATDNSNPLGNGAIVLNAGTGNTALLTLTGATPAIGSLSNTGTGLSQVILGNSVTPSGTALTVGALGTTTTFSGVISDAGSGGTGSLIKVGAGELLLSGVNTFSGGTTINAGSIGANSDASLGAAAGTLLINAGTLEDTISYTSSRQYEVGNTASTLKIDAGQMLTLNTGITDGSTTGTLNVTGPGTLALLGAGSYSGGTIIGGGATVQVNSATSLGAVGGVALINAGTVEDTTSFTSSRQYQVGSASSTIKVDAGQTLTLNTGITNGSSTGTLNVTGPGTLALLGTGSYSGGTIIGGNATVQINSASSLGAVGGIAVINAAAVEDTAGFTSARQFEVGNAASTIKVDAGQTFTLTTGITDGSSTGTLNVTGPGTLALLGSGSYSGGTIIGGNADVQVNSANSLGAVGGTILINNATVEATTGFSSARQYQLGNTASAILVDSAQTLTLTTGITDGPGPGTLNVTGPGTLALAGPGTYSGGTVVTNGTLQLQNAAALGNGSVTVNTPAVLDLNGNSPSFNGLTGTGTVDSVSSTGASVLTLGANNASNTFAGVIQNTSGTVGFTAAGTGVQTLSGANTYSGPTTVNTGSTLVLASAAGSVTPGSVLNAGALSVTGTASVGNVSGAGSTSVAVGGSLTANGFTQASLTSNGTTTVNGSGTVGSIAGGGTLNIGAAGNVALTETQGTSSIGALNLTGNGTFDVTNNALLINYSAAGQTSPDAAIRSALISGSGTNGVTYNGVGIISSTAARLNAALVANNGTPAYGVGYADGSDPYLNNEGPAAGVEEVKLTLLGDLNLDGFVNSADFILFANSFGKTGGTAAAWDHGDLNYDGSVNSADFILFADEFGKGLGTVSSTDGGLTLAQGGLDAAQVQQFNQIGTDLGISSTELAQLDLKVAAVPEPASLGILVIGGLGLTARRRRRSTVA